jgi:hypothetical protein
MNAIVDALRAKYRTPQDALKALGLSPALLARDGRTCRGRDDDLRDESRVREEDGPRAVEDEDGDPAEELHRLLAENLSPAELKRACELLTELASGGEEDKGEGEEAEERSRRIREKYDAYEPEESEDEEEALGLAKAEREDTSGPMKPSFWERGANSRGVNLDDPPAQATSLRENLARVGRTLKGDLGRKPAGAQDAAREDFHRRFPRAPRDTGGGLSFCQTAYGTSQFMDRPRQPIASDSAGASPLSLEERFPALRRIQR